MLSFTSAVVAGNTVTLNCSYEGNPSPTVSWSHNETMLDPEGDPNLSETVNDGYALLEVTFFDIDDIKEYKCKVKNIVGLGSSEIQGIYQHIFATLYISTLFRIVLHVLHHLHV